MKKIVLSVIAASMLLSNVVFATSKTTTNKNHTISSSSQIKLQTQDPEGW